MKKRQLFLYALSLSVSAAAFDGVSVFADSDYSNQTITAKVTSIDGSSVDLQVGELNLPEMPEGGEMQTPPDGNGPSNDAQGSDGQSSNAQTLPEKPDDTGNGAQGSDGQSSDAQTPPEKPDDNGNGAQGSDGQSNDAQTPPEKPDDNSNGAQDSDGQNSDAQTPPEMPNGGGMNFFTAGDDTLTLDFADTEILVENGKDTEEGSLDDIAADSILFIEFDENGDVAQVTVLSTQPDGMGAPDGNGAPN